MPFVICPHGEPGHCHLIKTGCARHSSHGFWQRYLLAFVALFVLGCHKPAEAPPAVAAPVTGPANNVSPVAADTAPRQNSYEKMKAEGNIPGTPEFVKKQAELTLEREKQAAAEAKAFHELEEVWLKKVEDELIPIEQFVKDRTPDVFDLKIIGNDPEVKLEADRYRFIYGLRLSEVAVYQELTQDPPAARGPALEFLQAYIAANTNQTEFLHGKALSEFAKAAMKAGSVDPLVKLHYAIIITDSIDSYPEDDVRDACYAMMKLGNTFDAEKRYPRCFALQAKYFTAKLQKHLKLSFKNLIDPEILSSWNNWLIEMSQDPRNFPLAYGRSISILNDLSLEDQRVVYSAMMKQPGIAPWLIHMIGGIYNNKIGWKYRGGGFANTVSEEGWKKLHEHQELARRHFLRAYSLQPKLPEAPCEMMKIALTSGPQAGSPTEWFLRTVKICFDFRQAYDNLEWSLRPRWGGSIPELLALAKACLDTERFDTLVPSTGLDLLIRIQQTELGMSTSIFREESLLPALTRYADALDETLKTKVGAVPWSHEGYYDRSRLAALFTHAGKFQRARQILLSLAHQIPNEPFYRLQLPAQYSIGMVLASTAELEDSVKKLDAVIQKGANAESKPQDFDEAIQVLGALRKSLNMPEGMDGAKLKQLSDAADWSKAENAIPIKIQFFLLDAEIALMRLKHYSANQWVKLTVDELGSGWEISASKSKCLPPDGIELTCEGDYHIYELRSLARFEPPYDVQVTVTAIRSGPNGNIPLTGVSLGPTDLWAFGGNTQSKSMRLFGIYPASLSAAVWQRDGQGSSKFYEVPRDNAYIVRVKAWDSGRYQFSINDLRVLDKVDASFKPGGEVIFGSTLAAGSTGTGQLKYMQIRRLLKSPPDDKDDHVRVEAFARDALQADEEDAMAQFDLGRSLFFQQKYVEAIKPLEAAFAIQPEIATLGLKAMKAICHYRAAQFAEAVQDFEWIRRNGFKNTPEISGDIVRLEYGRLLATAKEDKFRNGKLAIELIEPINKKFNSTNWEYLWVLAAAHAECQNFKAAIEEIDACLAIIPAEKKEFIAEVKQTFESKKAYRLK